VPLVVGSFHITRDNSPWTKAILPNYCGTLM
jgi:hypothetical protein